MALDEEINFVALILTEVKVFLFWGKSTPILNEIKFFPCFIITSLNTLPFPNFIEDLINLFKIVHQH
jgi:hypothetical protein